VASRKLIYTAIAHEQLMEWVKFNPKIAFKILELVEEISKSPFVGKGKPEPLKHQLKGSWSRRID
jgi:toxin YoeB